MLDYFHVKASCKTPPVFQVRDLKWTVGELEQVEEPTPSSMTKVYGIVGTEELF